MAKSIILFIIELFIGLLPAIAITNILDLGENPSQKDFAILDLTLATYMILLMITYSDFDKVVNKIADRFIKHKL